MTYCCTCRRCNSPRWCPSPGKVVHRGWVAARHRIFSWCACSLCRTPTMPTIWTILRPPLLRSPGKEKRGERFEGSSFFRGVVKGTWGVAGGIDVKATVKSHVETGQSSRNSSPIPTSLVRNPYSSIRPRDSSSLRPRLIDSYGCSRGKKSGSRLCTRSISSSTRVATRYLQMALSTFGIYFILYFFFLPSFDGRDTISFVISLGATDKELEIIRSIMFLINNFAYLQESIEFLNFKFPRKFNDEISLMIKNRNDFYPYFSIGIYWNKICFFTFLFFSSHLHCIYF